MKFHQRILALCLFFIFFIAPLFIGLFASNHAAAQPAPSVATSAPLSHPIRLSNPPLTNQAVNTQLYQRFALSPVGLAAMGAKWSFYSRGVNEINAVASSASETWLATNCGVKVIDKSKKSMRHYTQLDGMPGMSTLTMAFDPEEAFCMQSVTKNNIAYAEFCALNRKTGVWKTLKETPFTAGFQALSRPSNERSSPGAPISNAITVASPERVCFAISPVQRDSKTLAFVYDRRLHLWDELPDDPSFHKDIPSLSLNWADVDRDGIWLGTNAGLLRWHFREKKWDSRFKNRTVYAGVKADDGTFWLATYEPPQIKDAAGARIVGGIPQAPMNGFGAGGAATPGSWALVKFTPKPASVKEYAISFPNLNQNAYTNFPTPVISGISLNQGTIWMTSANATPYQMNASFAFFLTKEEKFGFSAPLTLKQLESVPDVALAQPTLPRGTLLASLLPSRFQSWICTESDETNSLVDLNNRYKDPGKDKDGTRWTGQGQELLHSDATGVQTETFRMTGISFPTQLPITCLSASGELLFVQSGQSVYSYDLKNEKWKQVPVPRNNYSNPSDQRIIQSGDAILIGNSWQTLRYFPKSELFKMESFSENSYNRLAGEDSAGGIWLIGQDSKLWRSDPNTRNLELFRLPVLSKEPKPIYGELHPIAFAKGIIWLHQRHLKLDRSLLVGYDPFSKEWTPMLNLEYGNVSQPEAFESGGKIYLAMRDGKGTILCYDSLRKEWTNDLPAPPAKFAANGVSLASADDREVWGFSSGGYAALRFDRDKRVWESFQMPEQVWSQPTGNNLVRKGNELFLGSGVGIWSFDTIKKTWKQMPGAPLINANLQVRAANEKAVWLTGNPNFGGQTFVIRFDRKTSTWTRWTQAEGLPVISGWEQIVSDGTSCWALDGFGKLFHLNLKTDRWENVSMSQGNEKSPILFAQIVPDGKWVWLQMKLNLNASEGEKNPFQRGMIARYDVETGSFEAFSPDPARKYFSHRLEIDKEAAWVATSDGLFRFDKGSLSWKESLIPQALTGVKAYEILHIERRDKELWLIGKDSTIRMEL